MILYNFLIAMILFNVQIAINFLLLMKKLKPKIKQRKNKKFQIKNKMHPKLNNLLLLKNHHNKISNNNFNLILNKPNPINKKVLINKFNPLIIIINHIPNTHNKNKIFHKKIKYIHLI